MDDERLEVSVDFQRRDWVAFRWYMLLHHRASLIRFIAGTAMTFGFACWFSDELDATVLAISAAASPLGGALGLLFGFLVSIATTALLVRESNGRLGKMTYTVDGEGLHVATRLNETTRRWPGITEVRTSRSQILVGLGATCYMIVPNRAFSSGDERQQFLDALDARVAAAKSVPEARAVDGESA